MKNFWGTLSSEFLKARRSLVPLMTFAGFSLAPVMGGFMMIILKDPDAARRVGILRGKAELLAGSADWPSHFALLGQATGIGGMFVFAVLTSWLFGREFSDKTAKDLLALPTPRNSIMSAKFALMAAWSFCLTLWIYVLGLIVGAVVGLPGWESSTPVDGFVRMMTPGILTLLCTTPVAFVALAARGYLAPIGFTILTVVLAQVLAAAGWGPLFPYAVPAIAAGMGDGQAGELTPLSYSLVFLTAFVGMALSYYWWHNADQSG